MHKDQIFLVSFYTLKYLKSSLMKGSLLDTTILLIITQFIKINL